MRKRSCILFLILSVSLLSISCSNDSYYSYQQSIENVTQILYINKGEEREVSSENAQQLLIDLQRLTCRKYWNNRGVGLSQPYICVFYRDGSCEVISSAMSYYSNNDGTTEIWKYFEAKDFDRVLENYIANSKK